MGSHQAQHLKTWFVHGPDDDLLVRSKHVAFLCKKLVVLDFKVFLVILNILNHTTLHFGQHETASYATYYFLQVTKF